MLALHGDADLHVADDLRERMTSVMAAHSPAVVVDLSDVSFIDSSTLGVLVGGMKRARGQGGALRLVVPRSDLRRIFEVTLLDRVLPIDATRDEALSALGT